MKKWLIVLGAVLGVLLLTVIVLLGILIAQNARASEAERYDRAREICTEEIGPATADNLDEYAACADRLLGR